METELRTTRPVGVTYDTPIVGDEDSTACTRHIDWSYFSFDSNRDGYVRKGTNWFYTAQFMKDWEYELSQTKYVMRDEFKELLLTTNPPTVEHDKH